MPELTDGEKREVIRYLEADEPLPDKYRFLLFDDKREVELVWNGKTNEVTNVVLPFQIIEQVDEPRAEAPRHHDPLFDWAGVSVDSRGRQLNELKASTGSSRYVPAIGSGTYSRRGSIRELQAA